MLGCTLSEVLSVGNQLVDMQATHAAGVKFAACAWGMQEEERGELYKQADYVIENPIDLLSLFK
jgi:phosphoglycolate phosphatase-like HAD superfamily hydrolase